MQKGVVETLQEKECTAPPPLGTERTRPRASQRLSRPLRSHKVFGGFCDSLRCFEIMWASNLQRTQIEGELLRTCVGRSGDGSPFACTMKLLQADDTMRG